jgi:sarcosine oxidase subunit beta
METADVVVIGAGANGTSTVFHLAKAGVKRVVVIERQYLGSGATGKSGALVRMHYINEPEVRLAEDQPEVFSALARHGGWGLRFSAAGPARLYST